MYHLCILHNIPPIIVIGSHCAFWIPWHMTQVMDSISQAFCLVAACGFLPEPGLAINHLPFLKAHKCYSRLQEGGQDKLVCTFD